jgi:hypothetical protein
VVEGRVGVKVGYVGAIIFEGELAVGAVEVGAVVVVGLKDEVEGKLRAS